jgi:hypothetical protein
MSAEKLTLDNICAGAVPEIFQRSLKLVLANIRDPNADADARRTLTLEFTFKPHSDRAGADVSMVVKEKLATLPAIKGAMFVSQKGGELNAYPRDPRQEALFRDEPASTQ